MRQTRTGGIRVLGAVLTSLAVAVVVSSCSVSESPSEIAAGDVARAFEAAAQSDPVSACLQLAPGTRKELEDSADSCPAGIRAASLPTAGGVVDVQVYGLDAIVHLRGDTVFLADFGGRWRVTAAGCAAQEQDRPYSCDVKGG
ncbi:MAG: hypothetical protein JWP82_3189 [Humibacillus sp.]|nr:hypothetical protein [Humibacillus sp.]